MERESEEIRRPTGEATGCAPAVVKGGVGDPGAAVGACEAGPTGVPQEGQNLFHGDNSPPQDGQIKVTLRSGLWPTCQKLNAV